jgi:small basic protein
MDAPDQMNMTISHAVASQPRTFARRAWWLFSPRVDVGVFLGSAVVSLAALWIGAQLGVLEGDAPEWSWVPAVLLIDVAHVYATGFRVYFDTDALKRRVWSCKLNSRE